MEIYPKMGKFVKPKNTFLENILKIHLSCLLIVY